MSKHTFFRFSGFVLAAALLAFTGCKKDDDTAQENITTVTVHLKATGFDQEFEWEDLDGAGGTNPVIDEIAIPANTTFECSVHVYDRSKNPVEDITEEVEEEAEEHLFTFTVDRANLTVAYTDQDANGKPVGIKSTWTSAGASNGTVRIRLFHEPTDKGNLANPGGETDIDVTFPVKIQ